MYLPRLSQDAPKYYNSGVFHIDAKEWWESFIINFEDMYGIIPCEKPRWPVEILKNRTAISTPIAEPTVPDKISAIHKSQIENHGAEVIKDPYLI